MKTELCDSANMSPKTMMRCGRKNIDNQAPSQGCPEMTRSHLSPNRGLNRRKFGFVKRGQPSHSAPGLTRCIIPIMYDTTQ